MLLLIVFLIAAQGDLNFQAEVVSSVKCFQRAPLMTSPIHVSCQTAPLEQSEMLCCLSGVRAGRHTCLQMGLFDYVQVL